MPPPVVEDPRLGPMGGNSPVAGGNPPQLATTLPQATVALLDHTLQKYLCLELVRIVYLYRIILMEINPRLIAARVPDAARLLPLYP